MRLQSTLEPLLGVLASRQYDLRVDNVLADLRAQHSETRLQMQKPSDKHVQYFLSDGQSRRVTARTKETGNCLI